MSHGRSIYLATSEGDFLPRAGGFAGDLLYVGDLLVVGRDGRCNVAPEVMEALDMLRRFICS